MPHPATTLLESVENDLDHFHDIPGHLTVAEKH